MQPPFNENQSLFQLSVSLLEISENSEGKSSGEGALVEFMSLITF